jgi:adenylate kinase
MNILVDLAYETWIQIARLFNLRRRNALFVVIMGRAGAGKGTIAKDLSTKLSKEAAEKAAKEAAEKAGKELSEKAVKELSEKTRFPHLSTGDLVRRAIANDPDFAAQWLPEMKKGKLLPDWVVFHLLSEELAKPEYDRGAVLDGFPRTLAQAKMLRRMLAWRGNKVDIVVNLDVPKPDLIERLSGRRTCTNSACSNGSPAVYHVKFNPPKVEGICDVCGSAIKQREDETPEAIEERFQEYDRTNAPLFRYYEDNKLLVNIRSTNELGREKVFEAVVFAVEEVD